MRLLVVLASLMVMSISSTALNSPQPLIKMITDESGELFVDVDIMTTLAQCATNKEVVHYIFAHSALAEKLLVQSPALRDIFRTHCEKRDKVLSELDGLEQHEIVIKVGEYYQSLEKNRAEYWKAMMVKEKILQTLVQPLKKWRQYCGEPVIPEDCQELIHVYFTDRIIGLNRTQPLARELSETALIALNDNGLYFRKSLFDFLVHAPLPLIKTGRVFESYVQQWLTTTDDGTKAKAAYTAKHEKFKRTLAATDNHREIDQCIKDYKDTSCRLSLELTEFFEKSPSVARFIAELNNERPEAAFNTLLLMLNKELRLQLGFADE